jgi:hypothetical protein
MAASRPEPFNSRCLMQKLLGLSNGWLVPRAACHKGILTDSYFFTFNNRTTILAL